MELALEMTELVTNMGLAMAVVASRLVVRGLTPIWGIMLTYLWGMGRQHRAILTGNTLAEPGPTFEADGTGMY